MPRGSVGPMAGCMRVHISVRPCHTISVELKVEKSSLLPEQFGVIASRPAICDKV